MGFRLGRLIAAIVVLLYFGIALYGHVLDGKWMVSASDSILLVAGVLVALYVIVTTVFVSSKEPSPTDKPD